MEHIGLCIYAVGCGIALIMAIYEMIQTEKLYEVNKDLKPDYSYLAPYVMLSWFTVILNIYHYYRKNTEQ